MVDIAKVWMVQLTGYGAFHHNLIFFDAERAKAAFSHAVEVRSSMPKDGLHAVFTYTDDTGMTACLNLVNHIIILTTPTQMADANRCREEINEWIAEHSTGKTLAGFSSK